MHEKIRAIVYAQGSEAALDRAKNIFERLTNNQEPFDYYSILGQPYKATSSKGKGFIDEGWQYTKDDFICSMEIIRKHLPFYSNEDFIQGSYEQPEGTDWNVGMVRDFMHNAGAYDGSPYFLYDNDGEAIRTQRHLDNVLNKWAVLYEEENKSNPYKNDGIWVICADVHY